MKCEEKQRITILEHCLYSYSRD